MLPAKRRRFNSHPQFTPRQLFAAMQGAWLEPVLGNMWQENTGVTPVSAPTQTVGLLLDQSQGLLLGPELVSNGTFDANTTGWTVGGGSATISNPSGRLRISATVNGTTSLIATSALSTVIGCTYFVTVGYGAKTAINPYAVNLSNNSNGSGAHTNTSFDSISNTQLAFVATSSTTYIVLRADTSTSNVIGDYVEYDNISVRQVLGNHAYQATAANRPTYQLDSNSLPLIRHDTDDKLTVSLPAINVRRNLLTWTESLRVLPWTTSPNTFVLENADNSPFGYCSADKLVASAANVEHYINNTGYTVSFTSGQTYTKSVYAKAGGLNSIRVAFSPGAFPTAGRAAYFNLATGQVGTVQIGITASISPAPNGYYRCSITATANATLTTYDFISLCALNSETLSFTGDAVSGVYLFGIQLEVGSVATDYQKITDWTSEAYASSGSVYFATPQGMSALHNQSMGTTYNLPALSTDVYAWCVTPARLNAAQEAQLERYFLRKAGIAGPDYLLDENDNILTDDLNIPLLAG